MAQNKESALSRPERNFADQVRALREDRGLSQAELAEMLSRQDLPYVTQATVSRIERAERPVRLMEAQALSMIFDRSVHQMTNPDSREMILTHMKVIDREGRRALVAFKKALVETAIGQAAATDDLKVLDIEFGNGVGLDPDTKNQLDNIRLNRANFAAMDLLAIAEEQIQIGRSLHQRPQHDDG